MTADSALYIPPYKADDQDIVVELNARFGAVRSSLAGMCRDAHAFELKSPAILVIGEVAARSVDEADTRPGQPAADDAKLRCAN